MKRIIITTLCTATLTTHALDLPKNQTTLAIVQGLYEHWLAEQPREGGAAHFYDHTMRTEPLCITPVHTRDRVTLKSVLSNAPSAMPLHQQLLERVYKADLQPDIKHTSRKNVLLFCWCRGSSEDAPQSLPLSTHNCALDDYTTLITQPTKQACYTLETTIKALVLQTYQADRDTQPAAAAKPLPITLAGRSESVGPSESIDPDGFVIINPEDLTGAASLLSVGA